jgi:hypothetical protein
MTDLNALIPADSPLFLIQACSINSRGEIVAIAIHKSTGDFHAYMATPKPSEGGGVSAAPTEQGSGESTKVTLPENVRELLQQRLLFGRFGARLMGPQ